MTPKLKALIDKLVEKEIIMNLVEQEHMAIDQISGYQGEKRKHRYNSRWRNESALCLRNYVSDMYGYRPMVSIQFASPASPVSYTDGINMIISGYEDLRMAYVEVSRQSLDESLDELNRFVQDKIYWISETKLKYMRDLGESTGKTEEYLQIRSRDMHEKYKKKETEFEICC